MNWLGLPLTAVLLLFIGTAEASQQALGVIKIGRAHV